MNSTMIGLDLAKNVFQVHGNAADGQAVLKKKLRRGQVLEFFGRLPPCQVGVEASRAAHYWGRELQKLGHDVKIMSPNYVKPYVKRNKNDAADAEAICEAMARPSMRFVPVKSEEQQAALLQHRVRDVLIRQRTQTVNALRSHLAEFGIIAPQGLWNVRKLIGYAECGNLPGPARASLMYLIENLAALDQRIREIEKDIRAWHRANETSRRLETIPGVGPLIASAVVATIPDLSTFKKGRDFAAWIGLTPSQNASGGRERLGRISKKGDRYLRRLLFIGALSVVIRQRASASPDSWIGRLLARKPIKVAAVALANKMARIIWAMIVRGGSYRLQTN